MKIDKKELQIIKKNLTFLKPSYNKDISLNSCSYDEKEKKAQKEKEQSEILLTKNTNKSLQEKMKINKKVERKNYFKNSKINNFIKKIKEFFATKLGKKILIILVAVVILVCFILVYGLSTQYKVSSLFSDQVQCFVINSDDINGEGHSTIVSLSKLEKNYGETELLAGYQYLELNGKVTGSKKIGSLNLAIYSDTQSTLDIIVTITADELNEVVENTRVILYAGLSVKAVINLGVNIAKFNENCVMNIAFEYEFDDVKIIPYKFLFTTY